MLWKAIWNLWGKNPWYARKLSDHDIAHYLSLPVYSFSVFLLQVKEKKNAYSETLQTCTASRYSFLPRALMYAGQGLSRMKGRSTKGCRGKRTRAAHSSDSFINMESCWRSLLIDLASFMTQSIALDQGAVWTRRAVNPIFFQAELRSLHLSIPSDSTFFWFSWQWRGERSTIRQTVALGIAMGNYS